ncbi:hypothetical protein DXG01_014914 [Tephrocybe rancida]|nr:hypothetical protein DXG01_014914 [Tephrocybe rancida]
MSPALAKFIFVFTLVINALLWSQSQYAVQDTSPLRGDHSLVKRVLFRPQDSSELGSQCMPLDHPVANQCAHVDESCPVSQTFLSINYLQRYFCTSLPLRPVAFVSLTIWLCFLFSTLGISASDFFTPNLSTLAQILGLDENVAGVTFLAFGNGSPDVFSTFSAMRAGSGSLAIGELLGAATFIVSCVVGSMCITKEFEVERRPFLRDVGFFTVAVAILLSILWDGKILRWEAGLLVALYAFYVAVVVIGSWLDQRRERERINAAQSGLDVVDVPYTDEDSNEPAIAINISPASPQQSSLTRPRIDTSLASHSSLRSRTSGSRSRSPSASPSHPRIPSFSLVGALEFSSVVKSLRRDAAAPALEMFDSPVTPYAGGHYHSRHGSSRHPTPRTSLSSHDPWDVETLPLDSRSPSRSPILSPISTEEPRHMRTSQASDYFGRLPPLQLSPMQSIAALPSIIRTSASPTNSNDSQDQLFVPPSKRQRMWHALGHTFHILFPTLHQFRSQSILNQAAGILAAPAVLLLTLTLPVAFTPYVKPSAARERHLHHHHSDGRLIDFEEEGEARALIAEEALDEMHLMEFNKWLMAAQCPSRHITTLLIAAALGGCAAGALVLVFSNKGNHPTARLARCSMGFVVAMVWIMVIADEIVIVLQTYGFIFGLSDALIGLTFFAVGNSLADLVANMSVATFAPIMGFSACFGGPMLNILIGVGVSGSYIIHQTGTPYELPFSKTLFVSGIGLLGLLLTTLVCVPLNKYVLTRRWGIILVSFYTILMTTNVFVELKAEHSSLH